MDGCPACGRDLPSGAFPFCPWCAAPLVQQATGQRKTVTILFCDLVDSTVLGSRVDPEILRGVLERYWSRARSVVESHGGTVEKFIGDAVVGVFGLPVLHEDDALRATRAATDLVTTVQELHAELEAQLGAPLAVRVGVNTGEVLADAGGETLVSGDAANVAARLQAAAAAGQVVLGEATVRMVRDAVDVQEVGPLTVKGKADPLRAFVLQRVRPASSGPVRRRRFCGTLVGRSQALTLAEAMYATSREQHACAMLTVVGDPGVGKTRLVDELVQRIGDEALVLAGSCLPYGEGITYSPIAEMMGGLADQEHRPVEELLTGVAHADEVLTGIDALLGRPGSTAPEMAWAFRRLVETLAQDRPVVLVVDDLQWAKPGLLDLLDHLTEMSRGASILLVAMARPEFLANRPTWGSGRSNTSTLSLAPLSPDDSRRLAAELLGADADAAVTARIAAAAEGIPLFVEETVAMLVDDGHLVPGSAGGWVATGDLADVTVPPTVRALLAARLDQLPASLRDVVDAASVVGRTFSQEVVDQLLGGAADLSRRLDTLVRADLVTPTAHDDAGRHTYAFTHLLLAETAYLALPKRRRADLHEAVARWIQAEPEDETTRGVVAFHLERAVTYRGELGASDQEITDETVRLLLALVDRSTALGDAAAAIDYADRACRLTPVPSTGSVQARLARSRAARVAGDLPGSMTWADEAEQQADLLGDTGLRWRARIQRVFVVELTDPEQRVTDTLSLGERAIAELTDLEDHAALADAYRLRSGVHNQLGRLRAAGHDALEALRHAHQAAPEARRYADLLALAMAPMETGDDSLGNGEQLLDELDAWLGEDPGMRHDIQSQRIWIDAYHGNLARAQQQLADRFALLLDQGSTLWAASLLSGGIAWCQQWSGDLEACAESLRTAAQMREQAGETWTRSTVLAQLALVLAQLGQDEEAQEVLDESRRISQSMDLVNEIYWAATDGLLLARRGSSDESERRFDAGLQVAAHTEFLFTRAELWLTRSEAREVLGDLPGALDAARQALCLFERKGFVAPVTAARTRVTLLSELSGLPSEPAARDQP